MAPKRVMRRLCGRRLCEKGGKEGRREESGDLSHLPHPFHFLIPLFLYPSHSTIPPPPLPLFSLPPSIPPPSLLLFYLSTFSQRLFPSTPLMFSYSAPHRCYFLETTLSLHLLPAMP